MKKMYKADYKKAINEILEDLNQELDVLHEREGDENWANRPTSDEIESLHARISTYEHIRGWAEWIQFKPNPRKKK